MMKLLVLAAKRLLWFVPTVVGLIVIPFIISHVVPADPVALVAGDTATPEQVAVLRTKLGLDKPLPVQQRMTVFCSEHCHERYRALRATPPDLAPRRANRAPAPEADGLSVQARPRG